MDEETLSSELAVVEASGGMGGVGASTTGSGVGGSGAGASTTGSSSGSGGADKDVWWYCSLLKNGEELYDEPCICFKDGKTAGTTVCEKASYTQCRPTTYTEKDVGPAAALVFHKQCQMMCDLVYPGSNGYADSSKFDDIKCVKLGSMCTDPGDVP